MCVACATLMALCATLMALCATMALLSLLNMHVITYVRDAHSLSFAANNFLYIKISDRSVAPGAAE